LRRLAQLGIGAVGAPIETNLGVEVLLRAAPRPRERYAARVLTLKYDPKAPDAAETSRSRVSEKADALARTFTAALDAGPTLALPGPSDASQPLWELIQWQDGSGMPTLTAAVKALALGAVTPVPVVAPFSFEIAQRVAPGPELPARYETELPAPSTPDLDYHVGRMEPAALDAALRWAENHLTTSAQSAALVSARLLAERARLLDPKAKPRDRRAALQALLERARAGLSQRDYERYLASVQLGMTEVLMASTSHPRLALGL
jgi:hypothetical protein